eukprot:c6069_g1_i1.p1 GENE.c6069_g1_i1~~c6069_g1_i1.p1  ORF type:complete len:228 (+),score=45.53 c6069_g1_i1:44-685(+)
MPDNAQELLMTDSPSQFKKRSYCTKRNALRGVGYIVLLAILVIVSGALTYVITDRVDRHKYRHHTTTIKGCSDNTTMSMESTYYGQTQIAENTLSFSVVFHVLQQMVFADGNNLIQGNMFICASSTGAKACGPFNCTNSFAYDTRDCSISFRIGDCVSQIEDECTGVNIESVEYNPHLMLVQLALKSHDTKSSVVGLVKDKSQHMKCPKANSL